MPPYCAQKIVVRKVLENNIFPLQQQKEKPLKPLRFQGFVVAGAGLEPATSGL